MICYIFTSHAADPILSKLNTVGSITILVTQDSCFQLSSSSSHLFSPPCSGATIRVVHSSHFQLIFGFIFGSFSGVWQKNDQNGPKNDVKNEAKNGYCERSKMQTFQ